MSVLYPNVKFSVFRTIQLLYFVGWPSTISGNCQSLKRLSIYTPFEFPHCGFPGRTDAFPLKHFKLDDMDTVHKPFPHWVIRIARQPHISIPAFGAYHGYLVTPFNHLPGHFVGTGTAGSTGGVEILMEV
jgi:hypothetical protein